MKRQKLSVVAAVILLLAGMIIGCDTAANSGSGGTVSESDLYGTWTGTVDTGITGIEPIPVTVEFQVNKMYKIVIGSDSLWLDQEGIWELGVNNTIIVSSEDGIESAELSYELNNNRLKIWGEALSEWSYGAITQLDLTR